MGTFPVSIRSQRARRHEEEGDGATVRACGPGGGPAESGESACVYSYHIALAAPGR